MRTNSTSWLTILSALTLTSVAAQPQNPALRGVTRLESGGLRLLHGSTAVYPEAARTSGIEGTVVTEATLDAKGHVVDAQVVSGAMELRAAALRSILDDHFALDGSTPRKVQLRVIFALEKMVAPGGLAGMALQPSTLSSPPLIVSTECPLVPDALCRDARDRLAPHLGSPLTPEKRTEINKDLADLDDHLAFIPRNAANGVVLNVWLRSETPLPVPGGVVGGLIGGLAPGNTMAPPPPPPPPPNRETAATRISVGGMVQQAKLIRRTTPVYPPLAKQNRISGVVTFSAIIAKDGSVQSLRLISGSPLLVDAARDAAKQWQYQPTSINGEPVEVATQITVNFTLSQ